MFLEALSKLGSATINLPLAQLAGPGYSIFATVGVTIPAASVSQLAGIGLFNHAAAERITKSLLETTGKTLTGHWMDATGPFQSQYPQNVAVGLHRIHGHHFLTDAIKVYDDPNLNLLDFAKHLGTDVVTKNGLPLLPEEAVRSLASLLGTTPSKIMPWVSMNLLDMGASVFAVADSGANVLSVVHGTAEWGVGYALDTFGGGAVKIAAGIQSTNPILLGSGAVDVACGAVTGYEYYTQPFFCGTPVVDILQSASIGAGVGAILAIAEIAFSKKPTKALDKLKLLTERVSTSTLLSGMSAISMPLSVTTSFGLIGFKLAKSAAESTNQAVRAVPIKAGLAHEIDRIIAETHIGTETMQTMLSYVTGDQSQHSEIESQMLNYLRK